MLIKNKKIFTFIVFILTFSLVACSTSTNSSEENGESGSLGDRLNIAMGANPPTLDPYISTSISTRDVVIQVFETLVTVDSDYKPVPMLAESIEKSDDGKTYTFKLREGIKFHNGKEMTSEDVVASMNRWLQFSTSAKVLLDGAKFIADGDYSVILEVTNPSTLILTALAGTVQMAAIMPKEVIDSASKEGVNEFVGTGPFKFEEWKQDQYIHISKNEDYQSLDMESNGLAGKKEVFIKDIYFHLVPDTSTQVAGLQTGEYDLLLEAPYDNYEQLLNDPAIETSVNDYGVFYMMYNKRKGLFTDPAMREAVNAGIDVEGVLSTSFMHEDIYEMDSSYLSPKSAAWHNDAGKDLYNQNDPEKAKKLLKEAGYNGEVIRMITTRDYAHIYNAGVVLQQQLEKLGLNVKLEIYDWPTALSMRNKEPEKYEIFITGTAFVLTPVEILIYTHEASADPNNKQVEEFLKAIKSAKTDEEAKEQWNKLQEYSWEYLPVTQFGHFKKFSAFRSNVTGFKYIDGPILWNTKITN